MGEMAVVPHSNIQINHSPSPQNEFINKIFLFVIISTTTLINEKLTTKMKIVNIQNRGVLL